MVRQNRLSVLGVFFIAIYFTNYNFVHFTDFCLIVF